MPTFKRIVQLVTARPLGGDFFRESPTSVTVIEEARVRFTVEKSLEAEPNSAHIRVWNLKEDTRGEVERRPVFAKLFGGHDGKAKRLFQGDVTWSTSMREGPNWVTEIQAADGQRSIRQAKVQRSYKAGAKAISVLREIAASMGLDDPRLGAEFFDLQREFASGLVLEGPSRAELSRILNRFGLGWSIQDGRLQILKRRGAATTTPEIPFVISQETGLQGSPEFGAPARETDNPTLRFQVLLTPELTPGRAVIVTSKTAKGRYRIDRLRHVGDTHADDWYTSCECIPL